MNLDLPPPLWVPSEPAIIRPFEEQKRNHLAMPMMLGAIAGHSIAPIAPVIASSSTYASSSNASSHTVPIPSGIQAGDLLFAYMTSNAYNRLVTPTGYAMSLQGAYSGNYGSRVFTKIATASEGSSLTVTATFGGSPSAVALTVIFLRINNNRSAMVANTDFAVMGNTFTSTNSGVSAIALTPSWGATTNLWLGVAAWDDATHLVSSYPSGYTISNIQVQSTGTSTGISAAIAAVQKLTASETTPPWTFNSTIANGFVSKIAIRQI